MKKSVDTKSSPVAFESKEELGADEFVLDHETALEQGFLVVGWVVMWISVFYAIHRSSGTNTPSMVLGIVLAAGLPLIVAFMLRQWISQDYVVERKKRGVFFRTRAFGRLWVKRVASFDQVLTVAVQSRKHTSKHGTVSWTYGLALVLKSGKVLKVFKPGEGSFETVCALGRHTANLLEVSFQPGRREQMMRLRTVDGVVEVNYPLNDGDTPVPLGLAAVVIVLVVGLVFYLMLFAPI